MKKLKELVLDYEYELKQTLFFGTIAYLALFILGPYEIIYSGDSRFNAFALFLSFFMVLMFVMGKTHIGDGIEFKNTDLIILGCIHLVLFVVLVRYYAAFLGFYI